MPNLYIISGCNGAGKTTASFTVLPEMLNCKEFVNAARGLSPFQPETIAFEAGRIMLQRINELLGKQADFAIETTLSAKMYSSKIKEAKAAGYSVSLIYFWLNSPDLAISRVKQRVAAGGHNIPENIILRRYKKGIQNLFHIFIGICDYCLIIDNSENPYKVVATKGKNETLEIQDTKIWNDLNALNNG